MVFSVILLRPNKLSKGIGSLFQLAGFQCDQTLQVQDIGYVPVLSADFLQGFIRIRKSTVLKVGNGGAELMFEASYRYPACTQRVSAKGQNLPAPRARNKNSCPRNETA